MKTCSKCGVEKSLIEFHRYPWADGVRPDCKECRSQYERQRRKSLGKMEMTSRKHGINAKLYEDVLGIQAGVCALCGGKAPEEGRALAIDHDHETGKLRGILCSRCNGGLGMFRDDPDLLQRAADYLKFWKAGWDFFGELIAWQETREDEEEAQKEVRESGPTSAQSGVYTKVHVPEERWRAIVAEADRRQREEWSKAFPDALVPSDLRTCPQGVGGRYTD